MKARRGEGMVMIERTTKTILDDALELQTWSEIQIREAPHGRLEEITMMEERQWESRQESHHV